VRYSYRTVALPGLLFPSRRGYVVRMRFNAGWVLKRDALGLSLVIRNPHRFIE
jgi:hypothetical protein